MDDFKPILIFLSHSVRSFAPFQVRLSGQFDLSQGAGVEIVANYKLVDINRSKLENLIHRIYSLAQIDITIQDRFGNPVQPREWFLVPITVVDEAVQKIRDGSITHVIYDPKSGQLVPR